MRRATIFTLGVHAQVRWWWFIDSSYESERDQLISGPGTNYLLKWKHVGYKVQSFLSMMSRRPANLLTPPSPTRHSSEEFIVVSLQR